MNFSTYEDDHDDLQEARIDRRRPKSLNETKERHSAKAFSHRGHTPTVYNGIHRRRKKRISW
jgi:hypothetical protein